MPSSTSHRDESDSDMPNLPPTPKPGTSQRNSEADMSIVDEATIKAALAGGDSSTKARRWSRSAFTRQLSDVSMVFTTTDTPSSPPPKDKAPANDEDPFADGGSGDDDSDAADLF